jgi:hypothetical protein
MARRRHEYRGRVRQYLDHAHVRGPADPGGDVLTLGVEFDLVGPVGGVDPAQRGGVVDPHRASVVKVEPDAKST